MSLLQLESLIVVAEEGHIGRAAKRLYVCQPPLTRRIRSLEDELGTRLFDRTPKGMRLRPEGESLVAHARTILQLVEVARNSIKDSTVQYQDILQSPDLAHPVRDPWIPSPQQNALAPTKGRSKGE